MVVILWKDVFLNATKYNKTNDWLVKCCDSRRIRSFLLRTVLLKNSKIDYQKILRLKMVLGTKGSVNTNQKSPHGTYSRMDQAKFV